MEENIREKYFEHSHKKHCLLRYLGIILATLLGAFLAFYFAVDRTIDKFTSPYHMMHRMDRMMMKENKEFNKIENDFMGAPMGCKKHHKYFHHNIIDMIKTPDSYKFIVDLKPFRGNENAVNVTTKGSMITISGESTANTKHEEYFTQISQSYLLDSDAQLDKLSKKKVNDKYIITIPIED